MTFDEIFAEWDQDGKFDKVNLDAEALRIAGLESKYWKMYLAERRHLRRMEVVLKKFRMDKTEFYTMGPHSETPKDWRLPPQGRVQKGEVEKYLEIDVHVVSEALKVADQEDKVDLLKSILNSIKGRIWEIGRSIEWIRWSNGAN